MIEETRTITENLGWNFSYGRQDFNNLQDAANENDPTPFFFLDPVTESDGLDPKSGNSLGYKDYEGRFMIVFKSSIDEVYDDQKEVDKNDGKWKKYIEPIVQAGGLLEQLREAFLCPPYDWLIMNWKSMDVINLFDANMDGKIVNFKIRIWS